MKHFNILCIPFHSIKLIPNGLAVSRRRARPTFIHVQWTVCLSERIVALGRCGANDSAKYFVVDQVWNDRTAAARLNQLLVDRLVLVAPAFFQ